MAKTAKVKKRQPSVHSRAARRASSPSLPTTKSTTTTTTTTTTRASASPPPHPASIKPHVLAARSAGITKSRSGKPLKRAQRLRALKGAERAEENLDKLGVKVAKSVGRERKVRDRRKGWEEVNEVKRKKAAKDKGVGVGNAFGALGEEEDGEGRMAWRDVEMDEDVEVEGQGGEVKALEAGAGEGAQEVDVVAASVPLPVEEDELL
ncbi:hypothetical protein BU23DRAFT_592232 [Bimuria novae-zelandiae CBS 107.79]|uniref:Ribosome biogenesis protein Alb1 n=1 Tax=Bimuria novae-zelandiae CBS 107.79 TaxID=1447943 RepID=A0A6A5UW16_9PLEO|nr:hypothetical protein BU23DRAFT_592232 [Bimuria novae-zelandiae CBS 107.79]